MKGPKRETKTLWLGWLLLAVLFAVAALPAASAQDRSGTRVLAMADIHGDFASATELLRHVGLLDDRNRWSGGEVTFVQTGDFTDRGPEVRRVMDLLMSMEDDASEYVVVLLGNHEVMNIVGALTDVTAADYASFADSNSERVRRSAFEEYVDFHRQRAERLHLPEPKWTSQQEEEWMESHPLGFIEHRRAFSSTGKYGRWLRKHPAVAKIGDSLFLHGGIHPSLIDFSVEDFNNRISGELQLFDQLLQYLVDQQIVLPFFTLEEIIMSAGEELDAHERDVAGRRGEVTAPEQTRIQMLQLTLGLGSWMILNSDGVLWFRGFAEWSDEEGASDVQAILDRYEVARVVVGHTPQPLGRIQVKFSGAVYLIDTGMLASVYPGGRPSMLQISDNDVRALYLDGESVLDPL